MGRPAIDKGIGFRATWACKQTLSSWPALQDVTGHPRAPILLFPAHFHRALPSLQASGAFYNQRVDVLEFVNQLPHASCDGSSERRWRSGQASAHQAQATTAHCPALPCRGSRVQGSDLCVARAG